MANSFWAIEGAALEPYYSSDIFTEAGVQEQLDIINGYMAAIDEMRTELAFLKGFSTLEEFDYWLYERWGYLNDVLDYFDYDDLQLKIDIKEGAWYTPETITSFCGEEVANPIGNATDGNMQSYWEHAFDHEHEVIWDIRGYIKQITKLEMRAGNNDRSKLTNLDIHIATTIAGLADDDNLVADAINITSSGGWIDVPFLSRLGRYIKFSGFGSIEASNEVRVQEIRVWVTPRSR